jgi:hypothetical protein
MLEPHNKARGEVLLAIDGRPHRLCLTLGALAELEAAFDVVSMPELAQRMSALSASDILIVLAALTAGGGEPISTTDLARAAIEPKAAAVAVAEAFQAALSDGA